MSLDTAYEKRSLILTSNLHPARFDTIFPKGLATAAVDRLLHDAHVIVTEGQSHRLTEAGRVEGSDRSDPRADSRLGIRFRPRPRACLRGRACSAR